MQKRFLAFVLGALILLAAAWTATATAAPPPGVQTGDQSATSGQQAAATSGATQTSPSNTNIGIRVFSDGNDGSVSQTNSADSSADASNSNSTDQTSNQSQGGAGGIQTSTQSADNSQLAAALSTANQAGASNVNIPIRVGSDGNGGNVEQSNTVSSDAGASNDNTTNQSADQSQAGGTSCACSPDPGVQTSDQSATNDQTALAASAAVQRDASNVNIPIRVGSEGNDGSVTQSNDASSDATAKNDNSTDQSADQSQAGSGSGAGIQTSTQSADNAQTAAAVSSATQEKPKNVNIAIRVFSDGDNGKVKQTNSVSSSAKAKNNNNTTQTTNQDVSGSGGCGCADPTTVQTAKQSADNDQAALAASEAKQEGAKNVNLPIRVGSEGNNGSVSQSNSVSSEADASNDNGTHQSVDQDPSGSKKDGHDCGCGPTGIQTASQKADSEQAAIALSNAEQDFGKSKCGCDSGGNTNAPVRVYSKGDDGSVKQSNDVSSEADAWNDNDTHQSVDQDLEGASSGTGIQLADQSASNAQLAAAASSAEQKGASNKNAPVRVYSGGGGGSVSQSNDASSEADASNSNDTDQSISQDPSGSKDGHSCGCGPVGIQDAKQTAESGQAALSLSQAKQEHPSNDNAPVRVYSKGDDGKVTQSNDVSSEADASNNNDTDQSIDQQLDGSSSGTGIQLADQQASNAQLAAAASSAEQSGASNSNKPVRVFSEGGGGSVSQSNDVSSEADASNDNDLDQSITQDPSGSKDGHGCGCGPTGIQIAGQKADNEQAAIALSAAKQEHASNDNAPVRVYSKGDDGKVTQSNDVSSEADASNNNDTDQSITQDLDSPSGLGIQVGYQSASNAQLAAAASFAEQTGASNTNAPVRVYSGGGGGSVSQSNDVSSQADAWNDNHTDQSLTQDPSGSKDGHDCGCGPIGIQVAGQEAESDQAAIAASAAVQDFGKSECGCHSGGNSNAPVRVWSDGSDGSVTQSNSADSSADASNENDTDQDATQTLSSGSGIGVQVIGQQARNEQAAAAFSAAFQLGASNDNSPVRVYSKGDGGNVKQSNSASSDADAKNKNDTDQSADQTIYGSKGCGCGDPIAVQVAGQSAKNSQLALALSEALQLKPKNANGGSSVWSRGNGGRVSQSNDDSSDSNADNRNDADQRAGQLQS
jgi:hypothetical protein